MSRPRKPSSSIGLNAEVVTTVRVGEKTYVVLRKDPSPVTLTEAERLVALDVIDGLSQQAIAQRRGVSRHTVANQLASAYAKLGGITRGELCAMGRERIERWVVEEKTTTRRSKS